MNPNVLNFLLTQAHGPITSVINVLFPASAPPVFHIRTLSFHMSSSCFMWPFLMVSFIRVCVCVYVYIYI